MQKIPICTHLSNIGIFIYHFSEGKADAGRVNMIVQVISHATAGIKKRFRFFKKKICCNDNGIFSCLTIGQIFPLLK